MTVKQTIRRWRGCGQGRVALAVCLVCVGTGWMCGCSWLRRPEAKPVATKVEAPPPKPAAPPEPMLAAAADTELTLFGEFPDRSRVPFHARATSPMRQHTFSTEGADFDVDVSPDGGWLVFSSTRHSLRPDLYLKQVSGQAVTQLTSDPSADVQPDFSPDGKWVAFASDRSGNWDLWLLSLEGGPPRQITHSPLHEFHPSFAPDGQRLVYCMFNELAAQWELWLVDLNRSGSKKMIAVGLFPQWSPVSNSIVYQRARERGGRWFSIWRVDIENGEPKFPIELASRSDMALIQPSWSRDGQWITYGTAMLGSGDADGFPGHVPALSRGDIWIMRSDGASPLQLTHGQEAHFGPVFGNDLQVFFTSLQNGTENVWSVQPLSGPITAGPKAAADKGTASDLARVVVPPRDVPGEGG